VNYREEHLKRNLGVFGGIALRDIQSGKYGSDGFLKIDEEIDIKGYIESGISEIEHR